MRSLYMSKSTKPSLFILTGAGISAESGIATFRDSGGLWENHPIEDVATPQGFLRNPALVHEFYNQRRKSAGKARANAAHYALAELEKCWQGDFLLVTQNIDDLHEKAGSHNILHMHGKLKSALCCHCGAQIPWVGDISETSHCQACGTVGALRPDIVWFGEMPYHMAQIEQALMRADIFAAIGTSGQVYPAAGFAYLAHEAGAATFDINLDRPQKPSQTQRFFDTILTGPATKKVPEFTRQILTRYL